MISTGHMGIECLERPYLWHLIHHLTQSMKVEVEVEVLAVVVPAAAPTVQSHRGIALQVEDTGPWVAPFKVSPSLLSQPVQTLNWISPMLCERIFSKITL